jgi:extracellular elastinolytic metalloproteinase
MLTPSPSGWNSDGFTTWESTQGNNVITTISGVQSRSAPVLNFLFDWLPTEPPTSVKNQDAVRKHLFYLINAVHDIVYQYGFTESAGNFQQSNFGKGGLGNDRVIVNAQSTNGVNNARFSTPPDGQSGIMTLHLFTVTTPGRDGGFDSGIAIHEYAHGISNRLTGGPSNVYCLQSMQSAGLGEVIYFFEVRDGAML